MDKKQLKQELKAIADKYESWDDSGEQILGDKNIKKYLDCLNHPDLKAHLIKTGLARNIEEIEDELSDYETAQDIINSFEYDLELLTDDELIQSKSAIEAAKKAKTIKLKVSRAMVDNPAVHASLCISQLYSKLKFTDDLGSESATGLDLLKISDTINVQEELLANGDLNSLENMLHSQVHTLNAIFTKMVTKMANAEYINQTEAFARIALKAQNQTRQTISTLAEVKGIKQTTFIHQVNQAHNQQVNNNGAGENLNDTANEKVLNHVDRGSEATGEGQNHADETVAIQDTRGDQAISNELIQARPEIGPMERVREAVSTNQQAKT